MFHKIWKKIIRFFFIEDKVKTVCFLFLHVTGVLEGSHWWGFDEDQNQAHYKGSKNLIRTH